MNGSYYYLKQAFKKQLNKEDNLANITAQYKDDTAIKSITWEKFLEIIGNKKVIVEVKYDGMIFGLEYKDNKIRGATKGGIIIEDLPVLKEGVEILQKRDIGYFVGFGELYGTEKGLPIKFDRAQHILMAPDTPEEEERVYLAIFDLKQVDDKVYMKTGEDVRDMKKYGERTTVINDIFKGGTRVHPAIMIEGGDKDIEKFWKDYVIQKKMEGIVVHMDSSLVKIKPKFAFDLAIVGISISEKHPELMGALWGAFIDKDNNFIISGKIGTGYTDKDRAWWADYAQKNKVEGPATIGREPIIWVKPDKVAEMEWKRINIKQCPTFKYQGAK